jgi:prepilin-type N-terminal cleavage/methylation domain-containing protein/prepilin-type processing-associated H-X9-DG protein
MQNKKGFTLIELLVVIAIIAILAAILFPVFANARDKARQISGLSNLKQVALGVIMYTNDYDDTFPIGQAWPGDSSSNPWSFYGDAPDNANWILGTAPYVSNSSVNIYLGPNDTYAGTKVNIGIAQSIGVNALDGWTWSATNSYKWDGTKAFRLGVFGYYNNTVGSTSYANSGVCKQAELTQPAATVLLTDLSSSDINKISTSAKKDLNYWDSRIQGTGNPSGNAGISLIGCDSSNIWSADNTFTDFHVGASYNGAMGGVYYAPVNMFAMGQWAIPNPRRPASLAFPAGPNGMVSAPYSHGTLANFAFTDGHAKALRPVQTNPDGALCIYDWGNTWTQINDPNNMWLVNR